MKRVVLFLATNLAVMLVLSLVTSLLGVNKFLTANGLNLGMLLAYRLGPLDLRTSPARLRCCYRFWRFADFADDVENDGEVEYRCPRH